MLVSGKHIHAGNLRIYMEKDDSEEHSTESNKAFRLSLVVSYPKRSSLPASPYQKDFLNFSLTIMNEQEAPSFQLCIL